MSVHKHVDKICLVIVAFTVMLCLAVMGGGVQAEAREMEYETRLFDPSVVHTIDIVINDWDGFLAGCENEEYALCAVVIDGKAFRSVGIRAKGNTSLSSVSAMGSSRYSFKLEFDHYDSGKSCYGLDKLCLNNLIQDATFMKDYLVYRLMDDFGADAPLCSYVFLTVNGEDWGLYLAVEGVEDPFLRRNYGQNSGALYKPDSGSLGGGRGNGRGFEGFDRDTAQGEDRQFGAVPLSGPGGMGSSDLKLQYIDDDPASYPNIFDNAKTAVTEADQARLIRALKTLSTGEGIEEAVNVEEVLRYFVVHNFVCNKDSYTGSMVHNYYLYEEDGRLSMIPWDYNLAFGAFQDSDAASAVNFPIDTPVSGGSISDRPMLSWIFADERYTALYHEYFAEFLTGTDFAALIDSTAEMIAPYVERDPTKFYSAAEFEQGAAALREFCLLRTQSVQGQLDGSIPATSEGQRQAGDALIDAAGLDLSDMGGMGGMRGFGDGMPGGQKQPDPAREGAPGEEPQDMPAFSFGTENAPPDAPAFAPMPGSAPSPSEAGGGRGEGRLPAGRSEMGAAPAEDASAASPLPLLAVSVGALLAGLVFAFRFRR